MRLEGKVALVTGGASGIGEALVRRFVQEGATVYLADVDEKAGGAVAADAGCRFVGLDVTDEQAWSQAMAEVESRDGRLDVLCNNAGIISNQPIDETTMDGWSRVLDVNVTGTMLGCRSAIALMRSNGRGGSIINTASTTSVLGLADDAPYTTSKAAVVGLTRSVATWCAVQRIPVRVNALMPGATLTAILRGHIADHPELEDAFNRMAPVGRMADPSEHAGLAVFLASDESSYCTGATFVSDGGLTAAHPRMQV